MVVPPRRQRLILPVAPLVGVVAGVAMAALFALLPTEWLETIVSDSGIPSIIDPANPPLHETAQLVLIFGCGGGIALLAWFAVLLSIETRSIVMQRASASADAGVGEAAPVLRRADAHPDAPARRPVLANRDLGKPFLEIRAPRAANDAVHVDADAVAPPVEPPPPPVIRSVIHPVREARAIPVDLDQRLSAYDPAALPSEPLEWFAPPVELTTASRRQTFAPNERFETFRLAEPPAPAIPQWPVSPLPLADPSETIHALLDRLERGVARHEPVALAISPPPARPAGPAPIDLTEDTLVTLRRLATGGR